MQTLLLLLLSFLASSLLVATHLLFRSEDTGLLLRADEVQVCFAGSGLLFFASAVMQRGGKTAPRDGTGRGGGYVAVGETGWRQGRLRL